MDQKFVKYSFYQDFDAINLRHVKNVNQLHSLYCRGTELFIEIYQYSADQMNDLITYARSNTLDAFYGTIVNLDILYHQLVEDDENIYPLTKLCVLLIKCLVDFWQLRSEKYFSFEFLKKMLDKKPK